MFNLIIIRGRQTKTSLKCQYTPIEMTKGLKKKKKTGKKKIKTGKAKFWCEFKVTEIITALQCVQELFWIF